MSQTVSIGIGNYLFITTSKDGQFILKGVKREIEICLRIVR